MWVLQQQVVGARARGRRTVLSTTVLGHYPTWQRREMHGGVLAAAYRWSWSAQWTPCAEHSQCVGATWKTKCRAVSCALEKRPDSGLAVSGSGRRTTSQSVGQSAARWQRLDSASGSGRQTTSCSNVGAQCSSSSNTTSSSSSSACFRGLPEEGCVGHRGRAVWATGGGRCVCRGWRWCDSCCSSRY